MDLKKWEIFRNLDPIFAADRCTYLTGKIVHVVPDPEWSRMPWTGGLMVMRNGDVYSQGPSKDLILLGVQEAYDLRPLVPVKIDALCGLEIQAVNRGAKHVIVSISDGRVYQWGEIIISEIEDRRVEPQFVPAISFGGKRVMQVACSQAHTVALTEDGQVYCWGFNKWGQLGNGNRPSEMEPVKISSESHEKFVFVACCAFVSFAIDSTGNVWSWGCGIGPLGYPSTIEDQLRPKRISGLTNIKKVAAGIYHAMALSNANEVYFWGQHAGEDFITVPVKIELQNAVDIAAMNRCSISALTTNEGKVYFWGFAYGLLIPDPVATNFASMAELFASLDTPMMLEPMELDCSESRLEKLRQNFDVQKTSDLKFLVEGKCIYVHRMVLKLCSDYFARMFQNEWKESNASMNMLEISDFTYEGFRTFLLYLYTGRIEPPPCSAEDVIELFTLADYYGEEDLKRRCEKQLKLLTEVSNVSKVYAVAVQHNSLVLHEFAVDFMIPNLNSVLNTEAYKNIAESLQKQLIQELVDQEVFIGLTKKGKK